MMRRRQLLVVAALCLVVVAQAPAATALSSPNSNSSDLDIVVQDFNDNLKYVDAEGNTADLGVDASGVGGIGDIDGDGDLDIAFKDSNDNLKYVDAEGNTVDLGVDAYDVGGIGDIDGDGDLDIAFRNTNDNLKYVDAEGNTVDLGVDAYRVGGIGDIDGDGFFEKPPTVDNSSATPAGTTTSAETVRLSIPITDPEFSSGDSVDITFFFNGNSVVTKTISSNQTVSANVTARDGTNSWSVEAVDKAGNSQTSQTFSFNGDYAGPVVSRFGPIDGAQITDYDGTVSADVEDPGFPAGDEVNVTVSQDGSQLGTTTIGSNQTVEFSYGALAGPNRLTWTVSDTHGNTNSLQQSFTTPATLSIYNASSPEQLITGTSNEITVSFFGSTDEVISRTTTDGTVDLSGIPAAPEQGYQIDVEDGDSYQPRSVVINSLFEQQSVFLLPTSSARTTVEFRLTDRTGRFQQPRLNVRKPITKDFDGDGNTTTEYRTVVSDKFSAAKSLTVTLERDTRHRLEIVNENGARRTLGSYTPATQTDVQELTIAQVNLAPEPAQTGIGLDAGLTEVGGQRVVRVVLDDPQNDTTDIDITVTRSDLDSNQTVAQQSISGPVGRQVSTFVVNSSADTPAYTVGLAYNRNGQRREATIKLGNVGEWRLDYLNDQVASLAAWVATIAMTGLVVIRSPRIAAVVGVILATLFSTLGLISIGPVPLGIAGATAILFVVSRGRGQ